MPRRKLLALGFAAASLLGAGLYARRGRNTERLDLYFEDGSMVSVDGELPDAKRLLSLARDALRAAR